MVILATSAESFCVAVTNTARRPLKRVRCCGSSLAQATVATSRTRTGWPAAVVTVTAPMRSRSWKAPPDFTLKRRSPACTVPTGASTPDARRASATAVAGMRSWASRARSSETRASDGVAPQYLASRMPPMRFSRSRRRLATFSSRRSGRMSLVSAAWKTATSVVRPRCTSSRLRPAGSVPRMAFTSRTTWS